MTGNITLSSNRNYIACSLPFSYSYIACDLKICASSKRSCHEIYDPSSDHDLYIIQDNNWLVGTKISEYEIFATDLFDINPDGTKFLYGIYLKLYVYDLNLKKSTLVGSSDQYKLCRFGIRGIYCMYYDNLVTLNGETITQEQMFNEIYNQCSFPITDCLMYKNNIVSHLYKDIEYNGYYPEYQQEVVVITYDPKTDALYCMSKLRGYILHRQYPAY